jgi:hypothetical protein
MAAMAVIESWLLIHTVLLLRDSRTFYLHGDFHPVKGIV